MGDGVVSREVGTYMGEGVWRVWVTELSVGRWVRIWVRECGECG